MIYTSRIPCEARKVTLTSASSDVEIDTNGLECTAKVTGGNVLIKPDRITSDDNAYILSDGDTLDFTGRIYVSAGGNASVNLLMFRTV